MRTWTRITILKRKKGTKHDRQIRLPMELKTDKCSTVRYHYHDMDIYISYTALVLATGTPKHYSTTFWGRKKALN